MKIKVTYMEYGQLKAKIIHCSGWFNLGSDLNAAGIYEGTQVVLKIELNVEADELNTEDLTK